MTKSPVLLDSLKNSGSARSPYGHTLTLRLNAEQYRRLRRFVAACEDRLGQRLTHQSILEAALQHYINMINAQLDDAIGESASSPGSAKSD